MTENKQTAPKQTLMRFPSYLRFLRVEAAKGEAFVSSATIAAALNFSAVTVRKDLELVATVQGKPRLGFSVQQLISDMEYFLGYRERTNAVVVGAGGLGRAILRYDGFGRYGITVIAAFDNDGSKVGAVDGKPVYPMSRLGEIVRREGAGIGILTVPRASAQTACDEMIGAGIRAILSFASAHLSVPKDVLVRYEDLAASLAALRSEHEASVNL